MNTRSLAANLPRILLSIVAASILSACGTPGPPKPMRSSKIGPKPVSVKPDGLRSWAETSPAKLALTSFVDAAVKTDSSGYVAPEDRLAVISENVLWVGLPAAPGFAAETAEAHAAAARAWLRATPHPTSGRPLVASPLAPVKEALAYLRANGFKIHVVSGGDPTLTRLLAEEAYDIAPGQIIGASTDYLYEVRSGAPVIVRLPAATTDPKRAAKPVSLYRATTRRPVVAFGAGEDDLELLEYTTLKNPLPSIAFVLRSSRATNLLDASTARGWQVINSAADWARD